jgi:hypothetical protein
MPAATLVRHGKPDDLTTPTTSPVPSTLNLPDPRPSPAAMFLRRTCREMSHLILSRAERPPARLVRLAMRLHLAACGPCVRFDRQVRLMTQAVGAWRRYADLDTAGPEDAPPRNPAIRD